MASFVEGMKVRKNVVVLVTLTIAFFLACTNSVFSGQRTPRDKHKISTQVKFAQDKVHAGTTCFALLLVRIHDGWHINSATPSEETLIGTTLEIRKKNVIDSYAIQFPKGIERKFGFSDSPLDVYEGTVEILLKLNLNASCNSGKYNVPVIIGYQACDDNVCIAPAEMKIELPLQVVPKTRRITPINQQLFEKYPEVHKGNGL